jgi:outer membrane protein
MTHFTRISCAAAVLAAAFAGPAAAQDGPLVTKMGFVNTERVMREANAPKQAQRNIESEFKGRDQEIAKSVERLKRLAGELEKKGAALPVAEKQKREREAAELEAEIERKKNAFTEDLNIRREEATKGIIEQANRIIKRIAEQEKFDIVFIEAAYANPRIDITDKVIRALNAGER